MTNSGPYSAAYTLCLFTLTHLPAMSIVQQSIIDEQTVLLSEPNHHSNRERRQAPLPKLQLAIVLLLQACEPVARDFSSPYINQVHRI